MTTRPCRGPRRLHDDPKAAPITSTPLCEACRRELARVVERIPEQYVAAYLALEPGQRYDVRAELEHGRRGKGAAAPLPLDAEADALMGRILEVVLCWHEVVVAAVGLSGVIGRRDVSSQMTATRHEAVVERTTLPRLAGETERGEFVAVRALQRVEAVDRPHDSTAGVAITTACATLSAHLDALLSLPPTAVTRTTPRHRLADLPDDALGQVRADGRALVVVELDGVDAALELFRLGADARRTLGLSRGATVFDRPCPGCDEPGLVLLHGSDEVVCGACGERWGASDWRRLEAVLKSGPPVEGSEAS